MEKQYMGNCHEVRILGRKNILFLLNLIIQIQNTKNQILE